MAIQKFDMFFYSFEIQKKMNHSIYKGYKKHIFNITHTLFHFSGLANTDTCTRGKKIDESTLQYDTKVKKK